jgi:hypothetical protein
VGDLPGAVVRQAGHWQGLLAAPKFVEPYARGLPPDDEWGVSWRGLVVGVIVLGLDWLTILLIN